MRVAHLEAVDPADLLLEDVVHEPVLLDGRQADKCRRRDTDLVEGAATAWPDKSREDPSAVSPLAQSSSRVTLATTHPTCPRHRTPRPLAGRRA